MPTSYTSLLGLALPVTGELSGTWGDTVNDYITKYVDAAVAGAQTISGSQTSVTLSTTNGSTLSQAGSGATGSAQYAIINCTGNPAGLLTVTAPATSKAYLVINATSTSQSVKVVGSGPTTGVTIAASRAALIAWNGSDFRLIATTDASQLSGILAVANGGTGLSSGTSGGVPYFSATTTMASSAALAANAIVLGGGAGAAPATTTTGTGVVTAIGNAVNTSGGLVTQSGTLAASSLLLGGGASTAISSTTTGTGVVTALGVNTGTAGAFVVNGGALGTPSSGTVTNLTGTASININGTVGATTPNTGAFTTLTSNDAVTFSATTQNIALGTSQTSGTWTAGGASQTGTITLDQSTKAHTLNIGSGATESAATKTINIGTGGVATSTTAIAIGSTNGTTITLNGTVNATTLNATTLDLTNIEVTNIKAKDGTAAASIADSTGKITVTTELAVDNLNLSGNTLSSTDANGNIVLAPNGTGDVQLDADTVRVGDSNANATITTNGTGDLILNTNSGTNSGSITIEDAANGAINITPNGTGRTTVTNLSATSPRITTGINDSNGNELFLFTATASAVNEFTVANAAAGSGPTLSSTGSDSNINITIAPKGTGSVILQQTDAGATAGPILNLYRNSSSPAASDVIGQVLFQGKDSVGNDQTYAYIQSGIEDATSTSEDGNIQFFTTAAGTTAERMRLDAVGNLGVGTTPSTRLHVAAASANVEVRATTTTSGDVRYGFDASGAYYNWIETVRSSGAMRFATANTEVMRIASDGTVGIGRTPSSVAILDVQSDAYGVIRIRGGSSTNQGSAFFGVSGSDTTRFAIGQVARIFGGTPNDDATIFAAGYLSFSPGATEKARITSAGDVGIGVSSPAAKLDVAGAATAIGLKVRGGGNTGINILDVADAGGAGAMILTATGKLQNTTSLAGDNSVVFYNNSTTGYGISVTVNNNSSGTYRYFEGVDSGPTQRIAIYTNGDVKNTNGVFAAFSDLKLKKDIVDAASQWDDIKSLRVRKYRLKNDPENVLQIGLIAQEVETVSPGLVNESQDEKRDEEGKIVLTGEVTKGVKYSVLYMKAIKALQEAMERIEQLEAKVAALEAKGA